MVENVPTWVDGSGGGTPLDAAELNLDSTAIRDLDSRGSQLESDAGFRPETYAANPATCGNGTTDDTDAFIAMAAAIQADSSKRVIITLRPGAVYRVGRQTAGAGTGTTPYYLPVLSFFVRGLLRLVINGNGAIIKFNDGLHIGTFDQTTGVIFGSPTSAIASGGTNIKYNADTGPILWIQNTDRVTIRDLTIDGNGPAFVKGGAYGLVGSTDYTSNSSGVILTNVGRISVENSYIHDSPVDNIWVDTRSATRNADVSSVQLVNTRLAYSGRINLWLGGAANVFASSCTFSDAGQGAFATSPEVGIDFEVYTPVSGHNAVFESCEFSNNTRSAYSTGGPPTGSWRELLFKRCTFRGKGFLSNYFATISGPSTVHEDCTIHGIIGSYLGQDNEDVDSVLKPYSATQFRRCTIEDADYIAPVAFVDAAGIPTLQVEATQSYGVRPLATTISIVNGTGSNGTNANRWRCQILYNGSIVNDFNNLNTVGSALAILNTSAHASFADLTSPSANPTSQPAAVTGVTLPVTVLDRSAGGLVVVPGVNTLLEDCTLIPHGLLAFKMSGTTTSPMVMRRVTVVPYNSAIADMASQSTIRGSILDSVVISEPPAPVNEVQTITIPSGTTGGTFTVALYGVTTPNISNNSSAAGVQTALETLANVTPGDVAVAGAAGGPYTVTFGGLLAGMNVAALTTTSSLTGPSSPYTVSVATTTPGRGGLTPPVTGWFVNVDSTVQIGRGAVTVGPSIHWSAYNGVTGVIRNPQIPQVYGPWTPVTSYSAGDIVTNGGILYRATTNFTSGASFNATNWSTLVDPSTGSSFGQAALTNTGTYISSPHGTRTTGIPVLSRILLTPIWLKTAVTVTSIACEVTTGGTAGSLMRLGIYADTGNQPSALVIDAGTVDSTITGRRDIAITQALAPGLYWLASSPQVAAPTCRTILSPAYTLPIAVPEGASTFNAVTKTGVSGAFSNPLTGAAAANVITPIVWILT